MNHTITRREFLGVAGAAGFSVGAAPPGGVRLPQAAPWPQDRAAAISLTFDDAMDTQLDHVRPILKKHGLRGTFFAITGPSSSWRRRFGDWENLAAEGNEIGSHTVHHPCLLKHIKPHAQDYTPEMMHQEIQNSCQEIVSRLGTHRGLTFAYPCGDMSFGPPAQQVPNQARYLEYVAEYCFAARTYNSWAPVVPEDLNPLTIPVLGWTVGRDFPTLLSIMEPARQDHHWGVFVFHGVGGQWLSIKSQTLDELAGYLEGHHEIWTATFGDAVRYIQEAKALGIQARESASHHAQFALTWPMDPKVYDLPLTLKWTLPSAWKACTAEADGRMLACSAAAEAGSGTVRVDVPAQTRIVQFRAA
ncbi:MAG: polysaccharide deacetylase family protein [Terriglobia bacterium]